MNAKSIKGKTSLEIKAALQTSLADTRLPNGQGFKPTLAFVFMSIKQDIDAVCNLLDQEGIKIFGATTGGEFIDGDIGAGTIAILLLDMDPANFLVLLEDYDKKDPESVSQAMARKAKERFRNPSFILSSSIDVTHESAAMGEPIIRAIETIAGKDTIIWGGRAGDDFMFHDTIVFTNHQLMKKGILLLVLDGDKITVNGQAASGQKPVGTEKTITKAVDHGIHELDNQPAAEVVIRYLGLNLTQEQAETFNPANIVFSVSRDQGDPVLRGVGMFDSKHKSIATLGSIKEGGKIRLKLPPDFDIVEEVSQNAVRMKQETPDIDALLMFSCIGRLGQFGPLVGDEIEGFRNVFNVPMAGFFTYGEFGRARNGANEFHNNTCCWVTLKEK